MSKFITSVFPKEHGAYIVLLCAWLFGIVYAPRVDILAFGCSLALAASFFLLQEPLKRLARHDGYTVNGMTIFLCGVVLINGGILLVHAIKIIILLIPFLLLVLLYRYLIRKRYTTIQRSLIGFSAIALLTPLTVYAADNSIRIVSVFSLWIFSALFFCTSPYCVAIRLSHGNQVRPALLYHSAALALCYLAVRSSLLTYSALIALIIPIGRLLVILFFRSWYSKLPIKYIGIQESVVALAGVLLSALYRF